MRNEREREKRKRTSMGTRSAGAGGPARLSVRKLPPRSPESPAADHDSHDMGSHDELHQSVEADDDEAALAASESILAESPTDGTAYECKCVALIKLSRYKEALEALDSKANLAPGREFERAYCLYMLNREAESLKTLEDGEPLSGRRAQLAAQIHYRLGNFEQAAELFRKAEADLGGQSSETSINVLAALVSAGKADEALEFAGSLADSGQFEQQYNHACAFIENGSLAQAHRLLQRGTHLCRKTLTDDGYSEEEVEVELAPSPSPSPSRSRSRLTLTLTLAALSYPYPAPGGAGHPHRAARVHQPAHGRGGGGDEGLRPALQLQGRARPGGGGPRP